MKAPTAFRGLVLNLAVLFAAGCDPSFTLHGDVASADGQPVAGAHVSFTCDGIDRHITVTGADGKFYDGFVGVFGANCAVEVRPPRAGAQSFPVMTNCTTRASGNRCSEVLLHVKLP